MARRRHLLAYDIADPRRLRRICKIMEEYGQRIQYSVFISDLSRTELVHARAKVEDQMNFNEDSVLIIALGEADDTSIQFIGRSRNLPNNKPQIV